MIMNVVREATMCKVDVEYPSEELEISRSTPGEQERYRRDMCFVFIGTEVDVQVAVHLFRIVSLAIPVEQIEGR